MTNRNWEFWIDVGGTFTDCCARSPAGDFRRNKLLSSGATKGIVDAGSSTREIVDPARRADPPDFWRSATLSLVNHNGERISAGRVANFDAPSGTLTLESDLSVRPAAGQPYELSTRESAPALAVRYMLGLSPNEKIPPVTIRLGTTRGTNALITRRGARTAFVTTCGFGDILHIGYQNRPRLFELNITKPEPLFCAVVEIDERISASGEVLQRPDEDRIRAQLREVRSQQIESLAICLLHASEFPAHENLVVDLAREVGFEEISVSHRLMPLVKIVARGDTTVMDAYLNPVLRRYTAELEAALPSCDLRIVTSAGGLVSAKKFSGKDSVLSGPAAGVVGFSRVAQAAGFNRAIGFDMGGTSTDVSRFDGHYEFQYETEKSGVRIVAPMLAIETVAAGGGSICGFDGVKLVVGPASAGADPGPACYGRGGPLAVTDLNLYLGKVRSERFPFPLNRAAVEARLAALAEEIAKTTGVRYTHIELAEKLLQVANANMVKAIRNVSIAKGCDPRGYLLVPFGGAAGQHACAVATELGIQQILHHPNAGLLSAFGIGLADHVRHRVVGVYREYSPEITVELQRSFTEMAIEAIAELRGELSNELEFNAEDADGDSHGRLDVYRRLDLRYAGLDAALTIDEPADGDYARAFAAEHQKLYGYVQAKRALEIAAARVEVVWRNGHTLPRSARVATPDQKVSPRSVQSVETYFDGRFQTTNVFERDTLAPGQKIAGPAIIHEIASTTVIDPGWIGEVLSGGEILVEQSQITDINSAAIEQHSDLAQPDPALLEIFNNQFSGIAEQMGITLRNTASSVNVKERLDFSCAIFTPRGELVVNAPHIPVHLGAMGETVRQILADNPRMHAGDVFVTNDPYGGGSHLPDVTVITPVFAPAVSMANKNQTAGPALLFFTANRAHHAEIGGIVPGSMPPFSKNLAEEGVLIRNFKLVDAGRDRFEDLRALLAAGPNPSRAIADNLADIAAQVAANNQGTRDLLALIDRQTLSVVQAYMRHIQHAAEQKLRQALAKLSAGRREFADHLDDGTPIRVAITIHEQNPQHTQSNQAAITIDFAGSGPIHPGNLNANRAIVTAAVMYVLRLLIDEDIPLNEGVLAPVELLIPESVLNPPWRESAVDCAAMVGGNVETSQRVVDVLLGAFGLAAASQGTMNNLLFGDSTFGYYETICGGAGATSLRAGSDAVHTHMTNTRITDPEVLEKRYPVRLHEFRIRRGSGGDGQHRGGDGTVRTLEFLRRLEVSILSQRRGPHAPYGLAGGSSGELGVNRLERADKEPENLPGLAQFAVEPGDRLTIETPGGGGWGTPG